MMMILGTYLWCRWGGIAGCRWDGPTGGRYYHMGTVDASGCRVRIKAKLSAKPGTRLCMAEEKVLKIK